MKFRLFKILCVSSILAISALTVGCSSNKDSGGSLSSDTNTDKDVLKVGIVQYIEHQSLDAIYQGIVDGMAEEGYVDGDNIEIDYLNGQGDQSNLKTISQRFVNNDSDIIIAIATPAAQTAAAETSEIPIVAAAVTDMVSASLVESNEAPGNNVTGVSDMTPVKEQIDLLLKIKPDIKNVGLAYCSNEVNSEVQINLAKDYLESMGIETTIGTAVTTNDIAQTLSVLAEKVDSIYIPVDNTFASAMPTVMDICGDKKLPVLVGAISMVEEGGLATHGFNYYDSGVQSGKMAVKLLEGGDPATTPVEFVTEKFTVINKTYADSIGLEINQELLDSALNVY